MKTYFINMRFIENLLRNIENQKIFTKINVRYLTQNNAPRSDALTNVNSNQIKVLIKNNQCYTSRDIANMIKIYKSRVQNYLYEFG